MHDLAKASIVVTGASSGIGRATATAFARRGARLALAARRGDVLEEVAQECRRLGGEAIAVPTDVTDADAMRKLAEAAETAFGRIDVWINNAGVGAIGTYDEVPLEMHRRIVEVNLLGPMHGAYAVLPVFLRQGSGILINNVSIGAWAPTPYAAAYTASKFGLRGFSASLRQELQDHRHIHVCAVFPSLIDTPGLEHGANLSGHRIDPGPYLYAPERVADAMVDLTLHPRAEVPVGWPSLAAKWAYGLASGPTEHAIGLAARQALKQAGPAPRVEGAVMHPVPQGVAASGGWRDRKGVPDATRINRMVITAAGAALCLGGLLWVSSRSRS